MYVTVLVMLLALPDGLRYDVKVAPSMETCQALVERLAVSQPKLVASCQQVPVHTELRC